MANIYPEPGSRDESAFERERLSEDQRTEEPSLATLLGEVVADAQSLVRKEIELAKQEVRVEVAKAKDSAISLGIGAAVAAVGGLLLSFMLVYLLSDLFGLSLWVSYLIVGALFAIVGAVLLQRGRAKMSEIHVMPQETIESVKRDVEAVQSALPTNNDDSTRRST